MIKRLVCLANSRREGNRCIAGRELLAGNPGEWIRPVSARESEAVSRRERQYNDGSEPCVLDIIDVPLIGPRSKSHQPENWLLDPDARWSKAGEFGHDNLHLLTDNPGHLWINGHHTTNGQNDYMTVDEADNTAGSLKLIAVDELRLRIYATVSSKRQVRAEFSFSGVNYCLSVTDPLIEAEYRTEVDDVYTLGSRYLTISFGEWKEDSRCYKLVAAIIGVLP
ncbi:MAG: dual OB domain-containing protein [Pseudonocardiaceae bacterium]